MPEIMTSIRERQEPRGWWIGALGALLLLGCSAAAPPDTAASPPEGLEAQVSARPGPGHDLCPLE